ncbi:MAG: tagatose 1,6-diphosphate aldolase [Candidatus Aquicultor sp.]
MLSIGKIRGLQQIADGNGIIRIAAMDQRGSLKKMLAKENPNAITYEELRDAKLMLCEVLAPHASAVLLDPEYGASEAIATGILPGDTGLLVSLEKSGYTGDIHARRAEIIPGWSVEKIKRMGGTAVKILVYYNPDAPTAGQIRDFVARAADECAIYDIPCIVETLVYPLKGDEHSPEFAVQKADLVLRTARDITALGIDLYKAEFPVVPSLDMDENEALQYCLELTEESKVPWVVLSAGVDFEVFTGVVEIACNGGASGFIAGRAIWKDAFKYESKEEQHKYLETTGIANLKEVSDHAAKLATPWFKRYGIDLEKESGVGPDWHKTYPGFAGPGMTESKVVGL